MVNLVEIPGAATLGCVQGLTYCAVAKQAGVPKPDNVNDFKYGRDAKVSNIEAIASVL